MAGRRELHDRYFRQAKRDGYAARSAYKLQQIQDRKKIIRPGDRVLDLGCAPGSWLQVAAELVGPRGLVVGIDLKPSEHAPPGVRAIVGDIFRTGPEDLLPPTGERFDCVVSDMAPSTSGAGDHFPSVELCRRVLEILPALLRPGGNLAMKVFEGEQYPALLRETARVFREAKGFKPDASRSMSREMYIVALGYRPPAGPGSGERRAAGTPAAPGQPPAEPGGGTNTIRP